MLSATIIIPAYNAQTTLGRVLDALAGLTDAEILVIDDASTDGTAALCGQYPVKLSTLPRNLGPAHARNLGARMARGELLVYLDADTCLAADAWERIAAAFGSDPALDVLIGAYDDSPAAPGTVSQFRNMLHCYIHRTARREGSTFWSGCGVVRREVFRDHGGFDETYRRASIEDLELGYRLHRAGRKIVMDSRIQVKHLKRWTLMSMIRTDVRDRGIPWTELILRERFMPDDLNLRTEQRWSVVGVFFALLILPFAVLLGWPSGLAVLAAMALVLGAVLFLNRGFYSFLLSRRGRPFTVAAMALHLLFYLYNGVAFGIGILRWLWNSNPLSYLRRRTGGTSAG